MTAIATVRPVPRAVLPDRYDLVSREALHRVAAEHPEAVAPRRYEYAAPGYGYPEVVVPSLHVEGAGQSGHLVVFPLASASADAARCRSCDPERGVWPTDMCPDCHGSGTGPVWLRADLDWWFIDGLGPAASFGGCGSGGLWWRLHRMEATGTKERRSTVEGTVG